ncbi:hypothetical protein EPIB1_454 [Tritonibacter mobilis]|nr:hypothetical protein EPIB1_454 [Tritonibacter mobilis]
MFIVFRRVENWQLPDKLPEWRDLRRAWSAQALRGPFGLSEDQANLSLWPAYQSKTEAI